MNKLQQINYSLYIGILFVAILLFLCLFGPMLAPHSMTTTLEVQYKDGGVIAPPLAPFESWAYPLGTDQWGYDILSMILNGLRYTVLIAVVVTMIKMILGTVIGMYIGTWKKVPHWIVAFENAWSYVPLFIIVYFFLLPINNATLLEPGTLITYFIIIMSLLSVPSIVSSVRKKTSEVYRSDFIKASTTLGAKKSRIIWHHIFPQLKESLLVMFILEIVYVITIMGQLALVNIFIGGTIVRFDPLIYLSVTKELSGLVGQARGNIYGNTHILIIPLIVLLFTTISFSLLASGLKNKFQADYQRTPWIKTGNEPKIAPNRKNYNKKKSDIKLNASHLAFMALLVAFILAGTFVIYTSETKVGVKQESKASYDIAFQMDEDGRFNVQSDILIKNESEDSWNDIMFFYPAEQRNINIEEIKIDKQSAAYEIKNETLKIIIPEKNKKARKHKVKIQYSFEMTKDSMNVLADWYPAAAVYQNGKWSVEKKDYAQGPMYHTRFSDFDVQYQTPEGYRIVTSKKDDGAIEEKGSVKTKSEIAFPVVIMKDEVFVDKETTSGTHLRLFADLSAAESEDLLQQASSAIEFFNEEIGSFPYEQLDIIQSDADTTQTYPGMIVLGRDVSAHELVQSVAKSYFQSNIASNPHEHLWISEGLSSFAASHYLMMAENQSETDAFSVSLSQVDRMKEAGLGRQKSNVPLSELKDFGFISAQPALQINMMINERYELKGVDPMDVKSQYLAGFYKQYRSKEVDTTEFIQFTKSYFSVPSGYFNNWLDTKASR
ncbi:ABC transporter permease subunit [Cytobacillus horneckiae]|uniref:ABC transporter permease subunit n=1 Tax=Cytobacillus horneckiae TaxID=549687 RepID=UPI0020414A4F|nr:ABC transporter permease subunit [Cytobacillus horneckiae]MCM3180261.1 ABC transporter permease subunit [Cytobacillus horneckiae]